VYALSYLVPKSHYSSNTSNGDPNAPAATNLSAAATTTTSDESFTGESGAGAEIVPDYYVFSPVSCTEPDTS
jgi:hypothetical protein